MRIKNEKRKIEITPEKLLNKEKNDIVRIFHTPWRDLTIERVLNEILNNKDLLRISGGKSSLLRIIGSDFEIIPKLWHSYVPLEEKELYLLRTKKDNGLRFTEKEQERLAILEKKIEARHRVLYANMSSEDKRVFTDKDEKAELTMYDKIPVAEHIEEIQLDPQNVLGLKKIGKLMQGKIRDYAKTHHKRDWEDSSQDIWLKALTKFTSSIARGKYDPTRESLSTYFKTIVKRTIADDYRDKFGQTGAKPIILPLDEERDTNESSEPVSKNGDTENSLGTAMTYLDKTGEAIDVQKALSRLTKEDQDVLKLHYIDGHSIKEIAERYGKKEGTVRVRLLRAKRRIRSQRDKV